MTQKEPEYIAHVCLNSRLPKLDPDFCESGFIDVAPSRNTYSEQCWKYCSTCEAKGYPVIKRKLVSAEMKSKLQKMREARRLKKELPTI